MVGDLESTTSAEMELAMLLGYAKVEATSYRPLTSYPRDPYQWSQKDRS